MKKLITICALVLSSCYLFAQDQSNENKYGEIHGNFQTDVQFYNKDTAIGAPITPEKVRMNSFCNLIYTKGGLTAGMRFESYLNALQGFDQRYQGNGIPFRYVNYKTDKVELTAGSFYEQFGSGLVFRSYEERSLGYDNAMDGFRVKYKIYKGIYTKALIGKQRFFFTEGPGIVRAADAEWQINETFTPLAEAKTRVVVGGSFVSKYQKDDNPTLRLPENVATGAGRFNVNHGGFNVYGEYAYKINDPSVTNNFIYKNGEAAILQASYSRKGLGVTLGAKHIDNMSYRSDRNATLTNLFINYLPAFTRQHTYNLLATLYPYATQPNGENGLQAELVYTLKKGSKLGGEYGTQILVNYSNAYGLDSTTTSDGYGWKTNSWLPGKQAYFGDFNVEISRKLNKKLKLVGTYANILYNKDIIQGVKGFGTIYANVGVLEINYKFSAKHALKTELQYLATNQDQGDWATFLAEYSVSPHWFFAVMDQYNSGNPNSGKRFHYPVGSFGYGQGAHRVMITYGRQRAGIFCVGGVCRNVPAANGLTISITSSF